ncbi:S41 family peptidase [Deinococcus lacus]|uniref:S41 family peptidase n=1 Tax=Deinococcus lacus TaxID=392561 RepID=A0ABW1YAN3_9DEIO
MCAGEPLTCPAEKAYPVLSAQLTALGDQHSFLQEPQEYQEFLLSGTEGSKRQQFGLKLAVLDGEERVVTEVVPSSMAERAGLQPGDVLETLGGQPYTYAGLQAARESGRVIQLGLRRRGVPLRALLAARESSTLDLPRLRWAEKKLETAAERTAILRIPTFLTGGPVAQRVHDLVGQAKAQGATAMIVDLRGNSGGYLMECDLAASAFVPVVTRLAWAGEGQQRTVVAGGVRLDDHLVTGSVQRPQLWEGPLAVLVDSGSASCSEFFAYEVQQSGRGLVVGEPTAGVGNTATRVFPIGTGPAEAGLQLTVLHYAKPGGALYPTQVQPSVLAGGGEAYVQALIEGRDLGIEAALAALAVPSARP